MCRDRTRTRPSLGLLGAKAPPLIGRHHWSFAPLAVSSLHRDLQFLLGRRQPLSPPSCCMWCVPMVGAPKAFGAVGIKEPRETRTVTPASWCDQNTQQQRFLPLMTPTHRSTHPTQQHNTTTTTTSTTMSKTTPAFFRDFNKPADCKYRQTRAALLHPFLPPSLACQRRSPTHPRTHPTHPTHVP